MSRLCIVSVWCLVLTGSAPVSGQTVGASALSDRLVHTGMLGGDRLPGHLFGPAGATVDAVGFVRKADSFELPTSPPSTGESAGHGPVLLPFVQYGAPQRLTGGLSALLPIKTLRDGPAR